MMTLLRGAIAALVIYGVCYLVGAAVQAVSDARDWDYFDDEPKAYTGFVVLAVALIAGVLLYLLGWAVSGGPS